MVAHDLLDVTEDISALESTGRWAVVIPYAGTPVLARFGRWEVAGAASTTDSGSGWRGPRREEWRSSLSESAYQRAVADVRERIARGDVYQANVCRVLSAPLPDPQQADVAALHARLVAGNPAPFAGVIRVPGTQVATASPELFLRRRGSRVESGPIKGTGRVADDLQDKDRAENVMIVDLMRNDLSRACAPGTIEVPDLLTVETHPGLVHLVSTVAGELRVEAGWPELLAATFPPGSVTGAPKSSALRIIDEVEPASREIYCGAIGWVDADAGTGELAVAIRTFWVADDHVHFGTGAGITWGSDPVAEWQETELKAARLIALASEADVGE
jgi:para-aminobenzoate synthetase component 1